MSLGGARILCVDDEAATMRVIVSMLEAGGYLAAGASSVAAAHEALGRDEYQLVLCDVALDGESGLDLIRELRRSRPDVATLMVTGSDDPHLAAYALELGAFGYLVKPFERSQLLIDVAAALRRRESEITSRAELVSARLETLTRLARAVEARDLRTGEHLERVGVLSGLLAERLGLDSERVDAIRTAAPLHDVGKIGIADSILGKPGPLTPLEREEMERHAEIGRDLLDGSGQLLLDVAAAIAWTHHERFDGAGYPRRLAGDAIPLEGRIVAVADVYDALTSDRPYRPAMTVDEALSIIESERGGAFDPRVVDAFLDVAPNLSIPYHEAATL